LLARREGALEGLAISVLASGGLEVVGLLAKPLGICALFLRKVFPRGWEWRTPPGAEPRRKRYAMRGFPNLALLEPIQDKSTEGKLCKTPVETIFVPMLEPYELLLVDHRNSLIVWGQERSGSLKSVPGLWGQTGWLHGFYLPTGNLLPFWAEAEELQSLPRISLEQAYPEIEFLPNSRNWWSRLKGTPPECIHLRHDHPWIATLLPDTLFLRGKRKLRREPPRPEVMLCLDCLAEVAQQELASFAGRAVLFEPDAGSFSQYFFLADEDFEAAGLIPDVAEAIRGRLVLDGRPCSECCAAAEWIWLSYQEVPSLDDVDRIRDSAGEPFCARHGARRLWKAFGEMKEASVYYMNLPYGESGAYIWI
jgi:hypothetical protein